MIFCNTHVAIYRSYVTKSYHVYWALAISYLMVRWAAAVSLLLKFCVATVDSYQHAQFEVTGLSREKKMGAWSNMGIMMPWGTCVALPVHTWAVSVLDACSCCFAATASIQDRHVELSQLTFAPMQDNQSTEHLLNGHVGRLCMCVPVWSSC